MNNAQTTNAMKYVTYLRVSTDKQGRDGLGIDAQRSALGSFIASRPGAVLTEFVEVESGRNNKRPQLAAALAECKRTGARLVVAKIDRLTRNAGFLFALMDAGVDFIAADNPDITPLTARILAVIAQDEAERISARTKAALQAKKAKGETLGTPANLTDGAKAKGLAARMENARTASAWVQAGEYAALLAANGLGLLPIAQKLNERGFTTRRGCQYQATTVARLLAKG